MNNLKIVVFGAQLILCTTSTFVQSAFCSNPTIINPYVEYFAKIYDDIGTDMAMLESENICKKKPRYPHKTPLDVAKSVYPELNTDDAQSLIRSTGSNGAAFLIAKYTAKFYRQTDRTLFNKWGQIALQILNTEDFPLEGLLTHEHLDEYLDILSFVGNERYSYSMEYLPDARVYWTKICLESDGSIDFAPHVIEKFRYLAPFREFEDIIELSNNPGYFEWFYFLYGCSCILDSVHNFATVYIIDDEVKCFFEKMIEISSELIKFPKTEIMKLRELAREADATCESIDVMSRCRIVYRFSEATVYRCKKTITTTPGDVCNGSNILRLIEPFGKHLCRRISNKYKMDDVGRVLFSDWTLVKLCRTSMRNAQYHHKKCTEETLAILRLAHERAVDFASTNWTKTSES